jgi:hypothetical protein
VSYLSRAVCFDADQFYEDSEVRSYGYFCQKMPASGTKRTLIQQSLISVIKGKADMPLMPATGTFRMADLDPKRKFSLTGVIAISPDHHFLECRSGPDLAR